MKFNKLDNATSMAINFSDYFGFKADDSFEEQIQQHPYYPSLLSISEVLENEAGIKNFAVKISVEQLKEVSFPCMAHLKTKGGEYCIIKKLENDAVFYELDGRDKKINILEFGKIWSGVVLVSETEKIALKRKFNFKALTNYLLPFLSFLLLLGVFQKAVLSSVLNPIIFIGQFISLLAGLIISVLLLIQSLGRSNSFIQQLCGADAKHNCNHILSSNAAKLTSWFSLSDLGFLYFSGSFILLLFSQSATSILLLVMFNLFALPFTSWSVYYQWKIAKTWCRLCLIIQGLFWVQALFSFFILFEANDISTSFDWKNLPLLAIAYLFPTIIWLYAKPLFKVAQQVVPLKAELNKFKFNVETFKNLLQIQKQYVGTLPKTTIALGNPNAVLQITMVSNPFCSPCAKAHQFLEEWIRKGMDFKLNIIYTFSMKEEDRQKHFFNHLTAIAKKSTYAIAEVLQDWYSVDYQKLDKWKEKYPIANNEEDKIELLEQINWCKLNEINGTPTFYINGYQLPGNYKLKDLKYVLMNLE